MSKIIINKHVDYASVIHRDIFNEDYEKSKGEILICNDPDHPSIYIVDNENNVAEISNKEYDDTAVYRVIANNKEEVNSIISGINETNESIKLMVSGNTDLINSTKEIIDNYTINNKKISENSELNSTDLKIDNTYSSINQKPSNIIIGDDLTTAISKLEKMVNNLSLVLASSINDLENKIGLPAQYDEENNKISESTGIYKLIDDLNDKIENETNI